VLIAFNKPFGVICEFRTELGRRTLADYVYAGNVAITPLVDKPNVGVHVRLPKSIFVPR